MDMKSSVTGGGGGGSGGCVAGGLLSCHTIACPVSPLHMSIRTSYPK